MFVDPPKPQGSCSELNVTVAHLVDAWWSYLSKHELRAMEHGVMGVLRGLRRMTWSPHRNRGQLLSSTALNKPMKYTDMNTRFPRRRGTSEP